MAEIIASKQKAVMMYQIRLRLKQSSQTKTKIAYTQAGFGHKFFAEDIVITLNVDKSHCFKQPCNLAGELQGEGVEKVGKLTSI